MEIVAISEPDHDVLENAWRALLVASERVPRLLDIVNARRIAMRATHETEGR